MLLYDDGSHVFLLSIANGTYTRESATGILVNDDDEDDDETRYFTTQVSIPEQKTSH